MTLTQIRYFVETAKLGNITHTANQMFVSQQVVSRQIKELETELGYSLFERKKNKLELTVGGERLFKVWKDFLNNHEQALSEAKQLMLGAQQKIRVGVLQVIGAFDWVEKAITLLPEEERSRELVVEPDSYLGLFQKLIDRKVDCIITHVDETDKLSEDYEKVTLCSVWPKLVISESNPYYSKNLKINDLEDSTLLLLSDVFSKYAEKNILNYCESVDFKPKKISYFTNISSLEMALHMGNGFAITYELFFRNASNDLKFIDLEKNKVMNPHQFVFVYHKSQAENLKCFKEALLPGGRS